MVNPYQPTTSCLAPLWILSCIHQSFIDLLRGGLRGKMQPHEASPISPMDGLPSKKEGCKTNRNHQPQWGYHGDDMGCLIFMIWLCPMAVVQLVQLVLDVGYHIATFSSLKSSHLGGSHNRWFTMENPIKIDDLEIQYPYFTKPPCVLLAFNLLATSQTCPCPLHFRYQNYGTYHG